MVLSIPILLTLHLQYYIMNNSGLDIADISINNFDNNYVIHGEILNL